MIKIEISVQPDDVTCGPTSLHAVYSYYGDTISLEQVINEVHQVSTGGTLEALLGTHALSRGYRASLYVYNIMVFDPTWFQSGKKIDLLAKLKEQLKHKRSARFVESCQAYIDFIELGGKIYFKDITPGLLKHYFKEDKPILTGLSSTYLYKSSREYVEADGTIVDDDVRGEPSGHFVVLCGYDAKRHHVIVADPHWESNMSTTNYYKVKIGRLINSIMLGVLTYDANLLIVEPLPKTSGF